MTKARDTASLVSSQTGIAVTISGDPLILGVGNTELIRVSGIGSIGIGTTLPKTMIDVYRNPGINTDYYGEVRITTPYVEGQPLSTVGIFRIINDDPLTNVGKYIIGYGSSHGSQPNQLSIKNGDGDITFYNSVNDNTPILRAGITTQGNVEIANGNLVFSTSGTGIDFGATGNGSQTSTNELLDDYEEGSWTPVYLSPGSSGFVDTGSFSNIKCFYTKVGRLVNLYGSVDIGGQSGNIAQGNYLDLDPSSLPYSITQADITTLGSVWWYANLGGNINASGQAITVSGNYIRLFVQTVVGSVSRNTAPMSFALSYITTQ
jgi:hypothetical protein